MAQILCWSWRRNNTICHAYGEQSWVEAVKELLGLSSEYYIADLARWINRYCKSEPLKRHLYFLKKNDTYKHLFRIPYRNKKKEQQLVYDLVKLNKVYENKYYNCCVFVWA
jgi:hypothetical protein